MGVERDILRHADMGCQMHLTCPVLPGKCLGRVDQTAADAPTLDVRIDGEVHQMGAGTAETQNGAADDPVRDFGEEDMVL